MANDQPRKRLPREKREQQILDAAEEVFSRGPYREGSMDEIAALCGVTKPMLYRYFNSKDGLYEATAERVGRRVFDEIDAAARTVPPGPDRIEIFVERYVAHISESRQTWWLLYSDASPQAVTSMRRKNASVILGLLADSFTELGIAVDLKTTELLAHTLVGAGEQMGRWWDENPHISRDEVCEQFRIMVNGAIMAVARAALGGPPVSVERIPAREPQS
jgi:AcrR family transcriptional regulator